MVDQVVETDPALRPIAPVLAPDPVRPRPGRRTGRPARRGRPPVRHRAQGHGAPRAHPVPPGLLVPRRRRRAAASCSPGGPPAKRTWPATWSNACCGHPRAGRDRCARPVERRLGDELGLRARAGWRWPSPDFAYRAVMDDGTVEHELCPVVVAEVDGEPAPTPTRSTTSSWVDVGRRCGAGPGRRPDTPQPVVGGADRPARRAGAVAARLARRVAGARPPTAASTGRGPRLDAPHRHRRATGAATAEAGSASVAAVRSARSTGSLGRVPGRPRARAGRPRPRGRRRWRPRCARLVAAGGKRLRPAFVYWGHRATGARPTTTRVLAARRPPLELLHTFALLHDDVMDRSAVRRGRPTAHRGARRPRTGATVSAATTAGSGSARAVLAGDLAFVWATSCSTTPPLAPTPHGPRPGGCSPACAPRSSPASTSTCGSPRGRRATAPAARRLARRVALLKSARYTVTRPLQLGAALAGARERRRRRSPTRSPPTVTPSGWRSSCATTCSACSATPTVTGKSRLDDLREGKRTLLVVRALRLAPGRRPAASSSARSATPTSTRPRPTACREIVAPSGALASVEALIAARSDRGGRAPSAPCRRPAAGRARVGWPRLRRRPAIDDGDARAGPVGRRRRRRARRPVGRLPPGRRAATTSPWSRPATCPAGGPACSSATATGSTPGRPC